MDVSSVRGLRSSEARAGSQAFGSMAGVVVAEPSGKKEPPFKAEGAPPESQEVRPAQASDRQAR